MNREKNARWRANNRAKYLAHKVVENAVASGRLARQPCELCGATNLVHAHHDDYSRPLDVLWLCPTHHKERHRELGADGPRMPEAESVSQQGVRKGGGRRPGQGVKLCAEQVMAIRNDPRGARRLATAYGVSITLIKQIRRGVVWQSV